MKILLTILFLIALGYPIPKIPFVHWELLSSRGEDWIGGNVHVLILRQDYKTNGTAQIVIDNLIHSAAVANGSPDTNYVQYPFVVYKTLTDNTGAKRFNTWVYLSKRNIPGEEKNIIQWMDSLAVTVQLPRIYHDSSENIACLDKWRWNSR